MCVTLYMFKYVASTDNCLPISIFLFFLYRKELDLVNGNNKLNKNLSSWSQSSHSAQFWLIKYKPKTLVELQRKVEEQYPWTCLLALCPLSFFLACNAEARSGGAQAILWVWGWSMHAHTYTHTHKGRQSV